jgi:NADH dehydrogenase
MSANQRPTVIVIGAGFGGLYATKKLAKADVDILLIDRHNFHLFSPLVYQVATSGLEAGEIAFPVRGILRNRSHVRFLLGNVEDIDPVNKTVLVKTDTKSIRESFDYLLIAAGSQTNFFGMEQAERYAFDLKDLGHAIVLRNHVLKCFENAAWTEDPARKEALTTMVVVGGGPTGLETAGALCELYRYVLRKEYAHQVPEMKGHVILVEMQDHLLDPYPPHLQQAARRQLEDIGVEVVLGEKVVEVSEDCCRLSNGRTIPTYTLVWAAGVKSSPLAEKLGVPLRKSGRVAVRPTLQVVGNDNPSYDDIYVVGDMAYLEDRKEGPYPMLIPIAEQQGTHAAKNIARRLANQPQLPFTYGGLHDRGLMATIGRSRAVGWIFYKIELSGFVAWIGWLTLHLITLMGFRNRINVFVNWMWNYLTYDRSIRIILEHQPHGAFANSQNLSIAVPAEAHVDHEKELIEAS